jgi:hypothetical protein
MSRSFGTLPKGARLLGLFGLVTVGQACASSNQQQVALVPTQPQQVLAQARRELMSRGYAIAERERIPSDTSGQMKALGGDLRAEHLVGPDMDTRGILYEVIEVTATPVPESGQTRITVRGGMESKTGPGMWVRVPSTRQVRNLAQELLRKLSQQ